MYGARLASFDDLWGNTEDFLLVTTTVNFSQFIKRNIEAIVDDWEAFARTLTPAAEGLDRETLRDFAEAMLNRLVEDMAKAESREEQTAKSRGEPREDAPELASAAHRHASERLSKSFTQDQLMAEFRALRSYVIRRWTDQLASIGVGELGQLIRFNEAVDELLTESLSHYRQQLQEAHEELRAAREREEHLRTLDQEKNTFLSMLAHELRNPLAPMMNATNILRINERELSERTKYAVKVLERQSKHMSHLVDDLLDTARISTGRIQLRREILDMAGVVQRSVEDSRPQLEARGLSLELSLPSEPLEVDADPDRLGQVINNLLDNALKFTDKGDRVSVELRPAGAEASLQVTDTGVGISSARISEVFNLFEQGHVRLDRTKGGLGLGLYLVRQLVEQHGGSVSAYSDGQGRGSRFEVRLPLAQAEHRETEAAHDAPSQSRSRRVLVVEDNADAAESLRILLEALGHDAQVAADGRQALVMAEQFLPDIVLLDLGLPDLDGFEVARELRGRFGNSLPLIAVSGYSEEAYRRAARAAGFDAHMVKPASLDAINQVLSDY